MNSKGKAKGSLAGMLASRIHGATSSEAQEVHKSLANFTDIHMEPVTPLFDESDTAGASSEAALATSQRIEVTREEVLEVVAIPSAKLFETPCRQVIATHANRMQCTPVETKKPHLRVRMPVLTRARSTPREKPRERDLSNMKELLKRTLSLGLHRHFTPTALLDGVEVDNKSHLSTQPSTECGTRGESIECKAVDSNVQTRSFTNSRSTQDATSHLAGVVDTGNFAIDDTAATSNENTSHELDLLNVLTFIEMDSEEVDWEETGVSAITAGSSYYGDATSSRRAVEGVPRAHCSKGRSLVDFRGTPAPDGDAKTNSDLFAFLEVSAIPNDIDQLSSSPAEHFPPDFASTRFKYSVADESKEFAYEDAVVIRDDSNKELKWHVTIPLNEMFMIDNRTESLLEVENMIDESLVSLDGSKITGVKYDFGPRTNSLRCEAHEHDDRDGKLDDEEAMQFVEVVLTKGTTTDAAHDFHTSQTMVVLPEIPSEIGSRTAGVEFHSVAGGTDSEKRTVQDNAVLDVKLNDDNIGRSTATCTARPDRFAKEEVNARSENRKYIDRNDECTEVSGVDYFEVPLESFELSLAGKVLDTEGSTFDDDSELAVIGKATPCAPPIATLGSVSRESRDTDTLLGDFEAVATVQPTTLSWIQRPAEFQSDFSAGNVAFRATTNEAYSRGGMESTLIEPVVYSSFGEHVTAGLNGFRDPEVEDIRKSLAVNGDSALRMLAIQTHKRIRSKTDPEIDGNAAFDSHSREALVDNDDSSGDDELTQNQESKPLISRTLLHDAFVVSTEVDVGDVTKWIDPECEPAFVNLCASDPLEREMTALTNPKQREHRSEHEEKKEDVSQSALDSVYSPSRARRLHGGSFYERKKSRGYGRRPLYDEELTWGFLHAMMSSGVTLLQVISPEAALERRTGIWNERAVTMVVEPGSKGSIDCRPVVPRLEWTTIEVNPTVMRQTSSIGLLDIHSIQVKGDDELEVDSDNRFYVTTVEGNVHVFQAGSTYDRDMFVIGVRNIIAWLCFHIAAGDATAPSMLYSDGDDPVFDAKPVTPDKFPALHRLHQMNHLAHSLLD